MGKVDWKAIYIVDSIGEKIPLVLYQKDEEEETYRSEKPSWKNIQLKAIDTQNVPRKAHLNIATLTITAQIESSEPLVNLVMVVHVSRNEAENNALVKTILNPVDE